VLLNGFTRRLKLVGVGYRAQLKVKVVLTVGYSHPVEMESQKVVT
jgi:large subunit ribosomal protein L6